MKRPLGLALALAAGALLYLALPGPEHGTRGPSAAPGAGANIAPASEETAPGRKVGGADVPQVRFPSSDTQSFRGGTVSLSPPEDRHEDTSGTSLRVKVMDFHTGRALAGERISVMLAGRESTRSREVTTDQNGQFDLEALAPGQYSLTTKHEDYLPDGRIVEVNGSPQRNDSPQSPPAVEIALLLGESLLGEVLDTSGQPLPGARLKFTLVGAEAMGNASAVTGGDGSFLVRGLRRGTWLLVAYKEGFRRAFTEIEAPAPGPVRLTLQDDPGFEVVVSDSEGSPVRDARVAVLQRTGGTGRGRTSGLTDRNGRIHLKGLPAEVEQKIVVAVEHPGHLPERRTVTGAELSGRSLHIALARGAELTGRVLDSAGAPVPDADVRLVAPEDRTTRTAKTTSRGDFRFTDLPPGNYDLLATHPSSGLAELSGIEVGAPRTATGEESAGIELVLASGAGAVSGTVLDRDRKPVPRCPVRLTLARTPAPESRAREAEGAGPAQAVLRTVTDRQGAFRFVNLPSPGPGAEYRLSAGGGRLSRTPETKVVVGTQDLELSVDSPGTILGIIRAQGPPDSFTVLLAKEEESATSSATAKRRFHFTSQDLWFRLRGVEPGTYTVSVIVDGTTRAEARGIEVLAHEETGPIELRLDT